MDIRDTLNSMTKDALIELVMTMSLDRAFGVMNRDTAETFFSTIEAGNTLIFIDICNMHAMNHKYGMNSVDSRIKNVTSNIRSSNDMVIRWGGDELIVIVKSGNVAEFYSRIDSLMRENDLYAVYGFVTTSNSLTETINRADEIVMATKLHLEISGKKPSRDAEYIRMDSVTVYA